jgi:hypothetical protein
MKSGHTYVILAVIVVLLLLLVAAYEKGLLDSVLPAKWHKHKMHFVGAFGREPGMMNCLKFPGPSHGHGQRWSNFNRCTWV